jgi:3-hydroxyisobutyrate dehydrogenase-like beta-hydroxyacid dehydrogenase
MSKPTVAIIAPGNMGAAVAARLAENGVSVVTSLAGRSAESAKRAAAAGMAAAADAEIAGADLVLSIVPPGEALALAERLAPVLRGADRKPLYVDCNAVSPATVERIAAVLASATCPFADAGIIGGPPRPGDRGPRFYVSGTEAARLETLGQHGLDVRVLDAPVGAASALKMVYGGLNKGVIALGAAMALAATRAGVAAAFHAELAASQDALLAQLTRAMPDMFPKAYRWVAEMEEVAGFSACDAERATYEGIAALYQRLADDLEGAHQEIDALAAFFARGGKD